MNWLELQNSAELEQVLSQSDSSRGFALFKHSTRCAISSLAKKRLESSWEKNNPEVPLYLINLIQNRDLSNFISDHFQVRHESPQLIFVKNGTVKYQASHLSINPKAISKHS